MSQIKITLVKSPIGAQKNQKATLAALGLGKVNSSCVKEDKPEVRAMIHSMRHLLSVETL